MTLPPQVIHATCMLVQGRLFFGRVGLCAGYGKGPKNKSRESAAYVRLVDSISEVKWILLCAVQTT